MFGASSLPTRNYKYDVVGNPEPHDFVRKQLELCRPFRNKLIELERTRRENWAKLCRSLSPELESTEQALNSAVTKVDELVDMIRARNAKERRKRATKEEQEQISEARKTVKDLRLKFKNLRTQLMNSEQYKEKNQELELAHREACAKARDWAVNELGLYTFTANGIIESLSNIRAGKPPVFRPWRGDGRLKLQVQTNKTYKPMTWQRATLGDSRLRIECNPNEKITKVHIRLGSIDRKPMWVECKIVLHRPLPENCRITNVYLVCKRVGRGHNGHKNGVYPDNRKYHYSVVFSCGREEGFDKEVASTGRVAVNPGWRKLESGLRVAYWVGDDDKEGQLVIPEHSRKVFDKKKNRETYKGAGSLDYWQKTEDLQAIRDKLFDQIRLDIGAFFEGKVVPEWAKPRLSIICSTNRCSKDEVLAFVNKWEGMPDDENIRGLMAEWRRKEIHLERWESDVRKKFEAWRLDYYRRFWAELRRNYREVVIEDTDYSEMRRDAKAEDNKNDAAMKRYRNISSPGILLAYRKEQSGRHLAGDMPAIVVSAMNTTITCHECDGVCEVDKLSLIHTCEHCGETWDIDANNCRNQLYRAKDIHLEAMVEK